MKTSLYIHIPFCKSKCSYCDFFSVACGNQNIPEEYISSLCNEIKIRKAENKVDLLETVYIGGGTPSLLRPEQFSAILREVFSGLKIPPKEITVEANPDDISKELLESFYSFGVTRISCGIQSFSITTRNFWRVVNRKRINELEDKWVSGKLTAEEEKEQEQLYHLVYEWENQKKPK